MKYKLPKTFFKENPLLEMSTAQLTFFRILSYLQPEINHEIESQLTELLDQKRRDLLNQERHLIEASQTGEEIIGWMRKKIEPINIYYLFKKAISMQDTVMPLLLKRLFTSGQDTFIENAAVILACGQAKYLDQLLEMYKDIRSPYARSSVCIAFGVHAKEDAIPSLLEQYEMIQRECPDKDYNQGPLLSIYLMRDGDRLKKMIDGNKIMEDILK